MSEYIPLEMQMEVINRLPVKSVLQFRSVSKQWKSLIDSFEFISSYRARQTDPRRLLVWYRDPADLEEKYVSFVDNDDDVFAQQQLTPTLPLLSNLTYNLELVGSSQGLFCFFGYYKDRDHPHYNVATKMAVVWNPSIRKSVCIPVPCELGWLDTVPGFGVCPITNDPTILKFTDVSRHVGMEVTSPLVEVFTLSRGSWRIPSGSNLPKKSIQVTWSDLCIGSYIYWLAFDHDVQIQKTLVISFDMTTEEFRVIDLPDSLATATLSISKVWDSLALLDYITQNGFEACDVWLINLVVPHSFTKLFTINTSYESIRILEFTNTGEPMMEVHRDDLVEPAALVVYDPISQHIKDTGIYAEDVTLFVGSYMETLLLLDQSDCSVLF